MPTPRGWRGSEGPGTWFADLRTKPDGNDGKRGILGLRSRISRKGLPGEGARDPRRRQATLGGRSGGPETAGSDSGSSRTSQAPGVVGSTGTRAENKAARSRSTGADGASLGARGRTGARPHEGPLQGRRRAGPCAGSAASPLSPPASSTECPGMSWPASQSPQLASADSNAPSVMTAASTSQGAAPQRRRSRDGGCLDEARMATGTLAE